MFPLLNSLSLEFLEKNKTPSASLAQLAAASRAGESLRVSMTSTLNQFNNNLSLSNSFA